MDGLTVGQVSGIINLWVTIVQLTLPLAFVLILVAFLENENSAVTWSVVGRALQASMWSSILSTDPAASRGVRKRVIFITTLSTISLMILGVTGVVTPLGLGEKVARSFTKQVIFEYLEDTSTFGQGTPSRSQYLFSRWDGDQKSNACPGEHPGHRYFPNRTRQHPNKRAIIGGDISQNITELFTSGISERGNLISGPFDVQYRVFSNLKGNFNDKNSTHQIPNRGDPFYTAGVVETLRSVILDDNFVLAEGLIVDAKNGGVGFRNHSAPTNLRYGGTWEESLLWLEPVSQCIDNNLTVDFMLQRRYIMDLRLTDRGGWVNLVPDQTNFNQSDSQLDAQLWQRTYSGAWMTNQIAAQFFNVTRNMTSWGKSYSMMERKSGRNSGYETTQIKIGDINGDWIGDNLTTFPTSREHFTNANTQCMGYGDDDMSNITNIAIKCSTIFGTAKRTDGGDSARMYDAGSNWSMPIYTCATAIKASVKVVTLTMNGTHTLENLRIDKVVPKNYSSISAMPVWAVENTGMRINEVHPFWGIVEQKYKDTPHIWTIQREHLWLPAAKSSHRPLPFHPLSSFALLAGPGQALQQISTDQEYSGEGNFALRTKWQKLTKTQDSVALIPNLIWTDIVANNLVGTKSVPSAFGVVGVSEKPSAGMLSVETYGKRITYNFLFGIPALVILVVWVASIFIASLMLVASRVPIAVVRELINHTSTGRSVTNFLYPETCEQSTPTKVWVRDAGRKKIGFVSLRRENGNDGESISGEAGTMVGEVGEAGEAGEAEGVKMGGTGLRFGEVGQDSGHTPIGMVFQSGYSVL
ncbi:hypothetical protein HOY80DRAFT_1085675, partial [Tuber brumale]